MSLSGTFCLLLVAVPAFRNVFDSCDDGDLRIESLKAVTKLQKLVGMTYWWPSEEVDGIMKLRYFNRRGRKDYFEDLQALSSGYVKDVHNLSTMSDDARMLLGKPNLHRLVELYQHSVPAFGHVRHFMELLLRTLTSLLKDASREETITMSMLQPLNIALVMTGKEDLPCFTKAQLTLIRK